MENPKILVFAGSLRKGSFNKKLARAAAAAAGRAGAAVTLIDLADFPMPVYDGDLEAEKGLPENARRLRALMIEHDGFLISTPEYNSGLPGPFKNVIDWASRGENGQGDLTPYTGKTAGVMSASPGALGGLRSLTELRRVLSNIGVLVIPEQVAVSKAHEAFGPDGGLLDERKKAAVENEAAALVSLVSALLSRRRPAPGTDGEPGRSGAKAKAATPGSPRR